VLDLDSTIERVGAVVLALAGSWAFWRVVLRKLVDMAQDFRGRPPTTGEPGQMGLFDRMDDQDRQLGDLTTGLGQVHGEVADVKATVQTVADRVTGLEEASGAAREEIRTVMDVASQAAAEARRIADALLTTKGEVAEGLNHLASQLDEVRRKQDLLDVTQLFTAIARGDRREQPREDEGTGGET
jgi:ABC-type transporter Mla subunit MlaD